MNQSVIMMEVASCFPLRVRGVGLICDREVGGVVPLILSRSPERKPENTEWRSRKRQRRSEQVKHVPSFILYNGGFCCLTEEERMVSFLLVGAGAGGFSPGSELLEEEEQEEKWPQFGSQPEKTCRDIAS